jgi:hypothetical protein
MDDPVAGQAVAVIGRIWRLEVHDSLLWFTCIRSTLTHGCLPMGAGEC